MAQQSLMIAALAMIAAGGVFYAFVFPYLSGEANADKRRAAIAQRPKRVGVDRVVDPAARRKQVADSLKELEAKQKKQRVSLETKLLQAGLDWDRKKFFLVSAGIALAVAATLLLATFNPFFALAGLAIGGVGVPNWMLMFLRKRRVAKFVGELPNAMDVITRGIKAGLPLADCLRIISAESTEPLRSEFRQVVEQQTMGLSLGESVNRLAERVPVTESNFFAIVINIQEKAGGNLSEALGNLSRVLRERKKMKGKVGAMSMEAKASAAIIGALPFIVGLLVYFSTPKYMELLWITTTGKMVMAVSLFWMSIGIMAMKKMINFDM